MSRLTDTERGARLALAAAQALLEPLPLFPTERLRGKRRDLWRSIHESASEQLAECASAREAVRG